MIDLDMSPYAAFVWPAWAISVTVLAGLAARAVAGSRRWKAELERLEAKEAANPKPVTGLRDDEPRASTPTPRAQVAQSAVAPE